MAPHWHTLTSCDCQTRLNHFSLLPSLKKMWILCRLHTKHEPFPVWKSILFVLNFKQITNQVKAVMHALKYNVYVWSNNMLTNSAKAHHYNCHSIIQKYGKNSRGQYVVLPALDCMLCLFQPISSAVTTDGCTCGGPVHADLYPDHIQTPPLEGHQV